ncbi:RluA family pseudouridine synthase [Ruminococcaceae bacterium OttesenSCG-928-I18]|nr:RluA family pseudouridine synthase [Ruminococcaceae bacterium OttesenSCG-928-I18]
MHTLIFSEKKPKRLDVFLLANCPGLTLGQLHKYLRENKIKTNGKKMPLATRLLPGDEVCLYLPTEVEKTLGQAKRQAPLPTVLFEDENLLALEKPAGLVSAAEDTREDSLLSRAKAYLASKGDRTSFLRLCHRLDTGTSGVILLAKNRAFLSFTEACLRHRTLEKTYLCVTYGTPAAPAATLKAYHTKDSEKGIVFVEKEPFAHAKPITTGYRVLESRPPLALLEVKPRTGRTHQIRAHLALEGTPILGDAKYGLVHANRQYRCRYQCLCAKQVCFPGESTGAFPQYAGLCISAADPWFLTFFT